MQRYMGIISICKYVEVAYFNFGLVLTQCTERPDGADTSQVKANRKPTADYSIEETLCVKNVCVSRYTSFVLSTALLSGDPSQWCHREDLNDKHQTGFYDRCSLCFV